MAKRYKIDEMLKIDKTIELPKESIDIINILASTVGANTYSKTQFFKRKEILRKRSLRRFQL